MKKLLSMFLAFALTAGMLCGCGSKNPAENSVEPVKTVVTILTYMGEASKRAGMDALMAAYTEKHPDVKFEIQHLDMGSFMNILQTRISGGEAPDIIMGTAIANRHLIEAEQIMDISDANFIKKQRKTDLASGTVSGKIFSLPIDWMVMGTFYNRDMFEEHNLPIPATYTEFMNAIHTFEEAGIAPFTRPFKDANNVMCDFCTQWYPVLARTENYTYFTDIISGEKKFSDQPETRETFELFRDRLECLSDDDIGTDASVSLQVFAAGKYPMLVDGSWAIGDIMNNNPDGDFGLFSTPISDKPEENLLYQATDDSWMVSSQTKHKDVVFDFLDFITSQEGIDIWVEKAVALTYLPASKDNLLPPVMQEIISYAENGRTMNADMYPYFTGEGYDKFNVDCQLFAAMNDRDVDKILEQLDDDFANLSN